MKSARRNGKNEFYTQYKDIAFECDHYIEQFKDKIIYCPCDNNESSFVKYFNELHNQGVIKEVWHTSLEEGVDFLGSEAKEKYKNADIIVTNPPFSKLREFIEILNSLNKDFIIWGTNLCCTYKTVFPLICSNRIRQGYLKGTCEFEVPKEYFTDEDSKAYECGGHYYIKVPSVVTLTTLTINRQNQLSLTKKFDPLCHLKYDNFDAINCNHTKDIPLDYNGLIGVPITYLQKHNPNIFEIVGLFANFEKSSGFLLCGKKVNYEKGKTRGPVINKKAIFQRIIIKKNHTNVTYRMHQSLNCDKIINNQPQ
jgi:hypothetical protein